MMHIMFVGNPGTGKSTLLNGLMGECKFKSGFSPGAGMTNCLQQHAKAGIVYMDTPGLADVCLRAKAAAAITEGLQQGGRYKIFFVFTLESGRVRPEDKASMELILKSAQVGQNYGVIINKVSQRAEDRVMAGREDRDQILGALFLNCDPTVFVCFNQVDKALEDLDNVVKPLPRHLRDFIEAMPAVEIDQQTVKGIEASNFDQVQTRFDEEMAKLKKDNEVVRQQLAAMAPALQKQAEALDPQVLDMAPMINGVLGAVSGIAQIASMAGKCIVM